ncbi:MAG: ABC transporter permease [Ruminococcus sp.]|nr:ABC transporter permease [Ruminococcus sp.]
MQRIFLLAYANLRKSGGQNIFLALLISLISLFCVLSLTVMTSFMNCFDKAAGAANAPEVFIAGQNELFTPENRDILDNDSRISEVVYSDALYLDNAQITFAGSKKSVALIALPFGKQDYISYNVVEEAENIPQNGIYVSKYFREAGDYELGERFDIRYDKIVYHFTIAGFVEDIYLGCVHSNAQTGVIFPEETYLEFADRFSINENGRVADIYLNDPNDARAVASSFLNNAETGAAKYCSMTYDVCRSYATMQPSIMAVILLAFAVILLVIAVSVMVYLIRGSLVREIRNISILKSIGYTSNAITLSFAVQYTVLTLIGSVTGGIAAVAVYSDIAGSMQSLTWITIETGISPVLPAAVMLAILVIFFAVSYLTAFRLRNISPCKAFSAGQEQVNTFKKDIMPVSSSKLPFHSSMAVKMFLGSFKQNVLMTAVLVIISFALGYVMVLNYNISVDTKKFVDVLMYEYADVTAYANPTNYYDSLDEILADEADADDAIFFETVQVQSGDVNMYAYVTDDYSRTRNHSVVYEGTHPARADEIAIGGKSAIYFGKKIGDTITLNKHGNNYDYRITGLIQTSMGNGFDCELVTEGYKKINQDFRPNTVYVYLKDNVDADDFLDHIIQEHQSKISGAANTRLTIEQSMGSYVSLADGLMISFSVISVMIIWVLLYLLIKVQLQKNERNFRIQKAVGFTSSQIRLEIFLSFVPVAVIGATLGSILIFSLSNPLSGVLFGTMGIMQADFTIPYATIAGLLVMLTAVSLLLTLIITDRIKYIVPKSENMQ